MAEQIRYDSVTGHMLYNPGSGHIIWDCAVTPCECGDPGCDACMIGQCCFSLGATVTINWTFVKDDPAFPCGITTTSGGITFEACDTSGTDADGTLYILQDSGIPGFMRLHIITPFSDGGCGLAAFIDVPCSGGTGSSHGACCGGSTMIATYTVTP